MSRRLIDRSPDLKRLRDEGYDVEAVNGFVIVRDVPYLNSNCQVKRGTVISSLTLTGDVTTRPDTHVALFAGEYPCHADGKPIERIRHGDNNTRICDGLTASFSFSAKPKPLGYYENYYDKLSTYVDIVSGPVHVVDSAATAKTFPVVDGDGDDSVFKYADTASSRAEITAISRRLEGSKVAILGLGGTGSYVLDLVAKTPVKEIHLFDGDTFLQHNAFRAPGAASTAELAEKMSKVHYFERIYSKMRSGIVPHAEYATAEKIGQLAGLNFVFLCMEGKAKRGIIQELEKLDLPFVDVGMGIYVAGNALGGIVRTTTSTPNRREHVWNSQRIPFSNGAERNEYDKNIQIADLNALNAALAVIKWKKLLGFYVDQEHEHYSTYAIGGNDVDNEDKDA
jgi:hypothetical protein